MEPITGRTALVAGLCLVCAGQSVRAQILPESSPLTAMDVYGNAGLLLPPRRGPEGIYPGSPLTRLTQLYGPSRRNMRRPSTYSPFALPGDLTGQLLRSGPSMAAGPVLPFPTFDTRTQVLSRRTQNALAEYGGFDPRRTQAPAGDASHVFARRYDLVRATSFSAPVLRSYTRTPRAASTYASVHQTPFRADLSRPAQAVALDEWLRRDITARSRQRVESAWIDFTEARFRLAARGFETAHTLDSDDVEALLGELVCRVSLGAARTAHILLFQIASRDLNPFIPGLGLADRYGSVEDAARVRINARLAAESTVDNPELFALSALLLWHLEDRRPAELAIAKAVRAPGGSRYAAWPHWMRADPRGAVEPGP